MMISTTFLAAINYPLPQAPFAALVRGEFMRGEFLGLTRKGVHWKHAGIIESFHLKTGNIRFLELNPTLSFRQLILKSGS